MSFLGPICFARMGDHVAVDVGELIASRVVEAAGLVSGAKEETEALVGMVECRICQEEDLRKNLESPCASNDSLKVRAGLLILNQRFWVHHPILLMLFASGSFYCQFIDEKFLNLSI